MSNDVVIPPANRPPFTSWDVRRCWYFVCAFTALTPFILYDISSGKSKADAGAIWMIVALNVGGHAVLISLMRYARKWERAMIEKVEAAQRAARQDASKA